MNGNRAASERPPGDIQTVDVRPVNKKENRSFYKKREKIHPRRVHGRFRTLKWWIMAVTLAIYYITPWLRWDRGPGAPDQAVLIDLPGRRFYFFFIEIWPQEIYYIAGLLIMAAPGLFLVTSVVGRAWCGYSCPQTVWTDLFLVVERFVEGDRGARIRLDKAPLSASKIGKRLAKFTIWLLISLCTGGAWVFYYADAPTLLVGLVTLEAPMVAYATIAILTFTTFVLGGLMREQVCTYMCPWPRIQGAMMDEESLTVTYRVDRGEPRQPYRKGESWEGRADCIDCNNCVVVCPVGIDIRDGQQLECITCSLCIDACDHIMERIGRPRGLIDYDSVANDQRRRAALPTRMRWVRPRTVAYFGAGLVAGCVMLFALATRADLDVNVLHDRNPLFTALSDGSVRNGYIFKILNKSRMKRNLVLVVGQVEGATLSVIGAGDGGSPAAPRFSVKPDRLRSFRLLVTVSREFVTSDTMDIRFIPIDVDNDTKAAYSGIFRGPEQ